MQTKIREGGNPATTSVHSITKSNVVLALLPVGKDGRGHTFTELQFHDFISRWVASGSYPAPVVKTHDQDRDRPAVGWVRNYFVEEGYLKGEVALLPDGEEAFYSTHPGWSVELIIDGNSQMDIRSLALLGKERPHFKNLSQHSQYYHEIMNEDNIAPEVDEKEVLMDELIDLAEAQETELNKLREQVEQYKAAAEQYQEAAADAEGEALYAELQNYGCDCDKNAIKSAYVTMGAEIRPQYRETLLAVASSAKSMVKDLVKSPKLLYGENEISEKVTQVRAKVKLMKLSDAYGRGAN